MTKSVTLDDVHAVNDLLARYCWYIDEGLGDEWAALYTEDGVFEGTRPEPVRGRAALAEVPKQNYGRFEGKMRHQYGNLYMEYGEDTNSLVARFYNQVSTWTGGGALLMMAVSTASLVRNESGDSWRIKKNSVVALH